MFYRLFTKDHALPVDLIAELWHNRIGSPNSQGEPSPLKYYFSTHFVSQIFTVCEQTGLSQQPHEGALVGHAGAVTNRRFKPEAKGE